MPKRSLRRITLLVLSVVAWVCNLQAHEPGLSTVEISWLGSSLKLTTIFSPSDAEQLLTPPNSERQHRSVAQIAAELRERGLATTLWEVSQDRTSLPPVTAAVMAASDGGLSVTTTYRQPTAGGVVMLRALQLERLPPGHRQFAVLLDERQQVARRWMLSAGESELQLPPLTSADLAPQSVAPTFWNFVWLGISHIWTGYDHLAFLASLLLVCRTFRSALTIVSCFTVAHSVTLALATLGVLAVPSCLTEPAIAASIVFVALENLVRRGAEPRGRWLLTFGFGLIHGLGFATALRELGVGGRGQGVALPLLTFNLGVELGQLAVVALALPLIWQWRKHVRFARPGILIASALIAVAGVFWMVERLSASIARSENKNASVTKITLAAKLSADQTTGRSLIRQPVAE